MGRTDSSQNASRRLSREMDVPLVVFDAENVYWLVGVPLGVKFGTRDQ